MKKSWVYFSERGNLIKIGFSTNPVARAENLQTKLLGVVPGSRDDEARFHRKFKALNVHGEWFKDSQTIRSYIKRHSEPIPSRIREGISVYIPESIRLLLIRDAKKASRSLSSHLARIIERQLRKRKI